MQITDLLVPERVALNVQVADKAMAIHAMVGMLDRTGCLRDADEYEKMCWNGKPRARPALAAG